MAIHRTVALLSFMLGLGIVQPSPGFAEGIEAITKPSKDVTLSFLRPGRIATVLVKEGDMVTVGQLLVRQDDEAEQAQLEQLKAQAQDDTRIRAAEADLAQKKVDYQRFEKAAERGAATGLEVEHARLDVTIAELSLQLAKFQNQQDQRKYEEARIHVERMRLVSPIDGKVERINVEAGESVDALTEVIRVVKTDPLWVDVPVPLPLVQNKDIRSAGSAEVEFAGSRVKLSARIIHIVAVAEMNTLTVRVELANSGDRPAGEYVKVSFGLLARPTDVPKQAAENSETLQNPDERK